MHDPLLLLVGGGRMGQAMLSGWLGSLGDDWRFRVVEPRPAPELDALIAATGNSRRLSLLAPEAATNLPDKADVIVLATKPQTVCDALGRLAPVMGAHSLVISIAAGIGIAQMQAAAPAIRAVVRAMPNIGASLGCAVSALYPSVEVTKEQRALADRILRSVGSAVWVGQEDDLHAVTAISGSGPAYYFAFCEAMILAARAQGLGDGIAHALAVGTLATAGRLIERQPDPKILREQVTSPDGTTFAGLASLRIRAPLRGWHMPPSPPPESGRSRFRRPNRRLQT